MKLNSIILFFIGAGLLACSSVNTITVSSEKQISVTKDYEKDNRIDSIISPYRSEMNIEMKEVIAHATKSFERGKPNGALNNWSADVVLSIGRKSVSDEVPVFCLLNWGGLRNSISAGNVLLEDIFKLMPFDNEIVVVKMPTDSLYKVEQYLIERNGEPIAGATLENGKLNFINTNSENTEFVYVVTSDYLMNGGDNMVFFEDRLSEIHTSVLMRDAMIAAAKIQKELVWNDEKRIILE